MDPPQGGRVGRIGGLFWPKIGPKRPIFGVYSGNRSSGTLQLNFFFGFHKLGVSSSVAFHDFDISNNNIISNWLRYLNSYLAEYARLSLFSDRCFQLGKMAENELLQEITFDIDSFELSQSNFETALNSDNGKDGRKVLESEKLTKNDGLSEDDDSLVIHPSIDFHSQLAAEPSSASLIELELNRQFEDLFAANNFSTIELNTRILDTPRQNSNSAVESLKKLPTPHRPPAS
jgi:hypothetical protein